MKKSENRNFNPNDYDFYVKEYIRKSEENRKPISYSKLRKEPFNLPDARWYIKNCPDKNVKSWAEFVDWCGFVSYGKTISKAKAIELIYKMQSEINRPLEYNDFRGVGCYHVSIDLIRKYWGTVNKMKKELGLEIVQESMMDKQLSKEEFDSMISNIKEYVLSDNRNFITIREINSNKHWNAAGSLRKYAQKYYSQDLSTHFKTNGILLGEQGCGISFVFDDGEHVFSQFEYMFSKFLRNKGLKYNIDYFRDVKYCTFISGYNNHMNCDYVINYDDKTIYVEIAGILAEYKEWYYRDNEISKNKSKENYRLKLKEKERMLKENGLIYFVLFPCDLTNENFEAILNNGSLDLKHNIEAFHQHNIDWVAIRKTGVLDYSKQFLKYKKKVV